ncbi:unnamed protein product [Prorocentrum cordatum]|uniref:Phospholipase B-like n=1 Tax=Prorocentrum cordatum TaxID=2364126 RepID=A0ABN9UWP9_9DINO|nr:unnamed protein product [Polarella glacialis]
MAEDIRRFDQSHFVMVVSSIAWEWHASRALVKTLEYCGAYHFGMWAHVFAEHQHYASNKSDLDQSASDSEFGHPYAFIGIPGIGSGMGWESLMYNTGHYEPRNLQAQHAVIRAVAYYDYVARVYRLQDVAASKSELYMKNIPPSTETVHNPYPSGTTIDSGHDIPEMQLKYKPYIGTMKNHITEIIEANEQVAPYNFVFTIKTYAEVVKVDPRPTEYQVTEFDRIWQNASARYFPDGSVHLPGVDVENRTCKDFVFHAHLEASPDTCGEGFSECCDLIDWPGFIAAECDVGVAPTLCRDYASFQLQRNPERLGGPDGPLRLPGDQLVELRAAPRPLARRPRRGLPRPRARHGAPPPPSSSPFPPHSCPPPSYCRVLLSLLTLTPASRFRSPCICRRRVRKRPRQTSAP